MSHSEDQSSHGDDDAGETDVTRACSDDESPSRRVIDAVSAAAGTDPCSLRPLAYTIDPEMLDLALASHPPTAGPPVDSVFFEYEGFDVTVYADGRTVVSPVEIE